MQISMSNLDPIFPQVTQTKILLEEELDTNSFASGAGPKIPFLEI